MTREWKPGDVAMHKNHGLAVVVPKCDKHFARGPHWHYVDLQGWDSLDDPLSQGYFTGPLVVIDPEDREQVERLCLDWFDGDEPGDASVTQMQDALRNLIAPPKPPEPTGLGAVVEAINDNRFVRVATGDHPWQRVSDVEGEYLCQWRDIAAVRILSDGVQP